MIFSFLFQCKTTSLRDCSDTKMAHLGWWESNRGEVAIGGHEKERRKETKEKKERKFFENSVAWQSCASVSKKQRVNPRQCANYPHNKTVRNQPAATWQSQSLLPKNKKVKRNNQNKSNRTNRNKHQHFEFHFSVHSLLTSYLCSSLSFFLLAVPS